MKRIDIIQNSIHIITEYYNNNFQPFFDSISDDILWVGPRGGQLMRGKAAILHAWSGEKTDLQFTMGSIEANTISIGQSALEVLLEYHVFTHFPNGETDEHHQRLHLSWGSQQIEGKRIPKIFMIHLSNMVDLAEQNIGTDIKIYASSPSDSRRDSLFSHPQTNASVKTVYGKGENGVIYCFHSSSVLYIESTNQGRRTVIHTVNGDYVSVEKLRFYEEHFENTMLRPHTSYLINPVYVQSVKRFALTLTDGSVIPVPEKKYTAFRKELTKWQMGNKEN